MLTGGFLGDLEVEISGLGEVPEEGVKGLSVGVGNDRCGVGGGEPQPGGLHRIVGLCAPHQAHRECPQPGPVLLEQLLWTLLAGHRYLRRSGIVTTLTIHTGSR